MPKHKFRALDNGDRACAHCEKIVRQNWKGGWVTIQGTHSSECGSSPPGTYITSADVTVGRVLQPDRTRSCGQVSIANLTGCTYLEACAVAGHNHGTYIENVVEALEKLGWRCPYGTEWREDRPLHGIAKVETHPSKRSWHWMAVVDGQLVNGYSYEHILGARVTVYVHAEKEAV